MALGSFINFVLLLLLLLTVVVVSGQEFHLDGGVQYGTDKRVAEGYESGCEKKFGNLCINEMVHFWYKSD